MGYLCICRCAVSLGSHAYLGSAVFATLHSNYINVRVLFLCIFLLYGIAFSHSMLLPSLFRDFTFWRIVILLLLLLLLFNSLSISLFFCVLCEVKFYASTLYWRLMYVCRRYRRHLFSVYCLLCIFLFRVIARSFAARTLLIVCPHINWIKFSCVLEPGTFSLVYWLLLMFIRFSYIYIYIFEESE